MKIGRKLRSSTQIIEKINRNITVKFVRRIKPRETEEGTRGMSKYHAEIHIKSDNKKLLTPLNSHMKM